MALTRAARSKSKSAYLASESELDPGPGSEPNPDPVPDPDPDPDPDPGPDSDQEPLLNGLLLLLYPLNWGWARTIARKPVNSDGQSSGTGG